MKSIIFVTMVPVWSMKNGSGGKALSTTIKYFSENGYKIYFITDQENDYSNFRNLKNENIYYIDTGSKKSKNKIINMIKFFISLKKFQKKSYNIAKKIISENKKENFVLYGYEVDGVLQLKKISKKYKLPLVTRFQGTIMSKYKNNLFVKFRKYPHLQALSVKSDLVIMTDDGTKGDVVLDNCKNNSKRLFIRNGVNILDKKIQPIEKKIILEKLDLKADKTVLLTVSRLEDWKRVDRSISAFNNLKNKEDYYLLIVGEGPERKKLERMIKEHNLNDNVKLLGSVKNEEVCQYMQLADIFLSFYDLSNVGNPLLEALCLGKPIITYDVGDTYKVINNKNGILLNDASPENISKTIEKINEPKILKKLSLNALEYSRNNLYSWDKRMKIELDAVEKLFRKGKQNDKQYKRKN